MIRRLLVNGLGLLVIVFSVHAGIAVGAGPSGQFNGSQPAAAAGAYAMPCAPDSHRCCKVDACADFCISFATPLQADHERTAWLVEPVKHVGLGDMSRPDRVTSPPAPPPRR